MTCAICRSVSTIAMTVTLALGAFALPAAASAGREPQVNASPSAWSAPTRVLAGHFQDISAVVDSHGRVHVAGTTPSGDLWYATDRTGSWTHKQVLKHSASFTYGWPSIALDEHDRVHIALERFPNATGDLGVWYVTDKGRTRGTFPTSPTRIAPPGNGEPVLKVSDGHLYLVVDKGWCCISPGTLQLRTNVSGHWTVSTIGPGLGPSFRLGSDHRARVAYTNSSPRGLWYAVASSPTGGFTRQQVPTATDPADTTIDSVPILALNGSDQPSIVWRHFATAGFQDVRYAWRDASGWHTPVNVASSQPEDDRVGFDVDTHGRPTVAIGGASLRVRVLSGGTWHTSTIASASGVRSIVVRRALKGHSVLAWTDPIGVWSARN